MGDFGSFNPPLARVTGGPRDPSKDSAGASSAPVEISFQVSPWFTRASWWLESKLAVAGVADVLQFPPITQPVSKGPRTTSILAELVREPGHLIEERRDWGVQRFP